ncbi:MAG: DUF1854 domain-containing protein [Pseudomonadota bacterium]
MDKTVFPPPALDFTMERNAAGRLVFHSAVAGTHTGVVPVRAFPITAPGEGLSLINAEGQEIAWIEDPQHLPGALRTLLEEELASREFLPEIQQIFAVSTFSTPSLWEVQTDRGATRFTLKGEEDIRRLASPRLLITTEHGMQFLVRDMYALDRSSRKLLERFL